VIKHTAEGAADFNTSVRGFGNSLGALNSFFNRLAFKPKGSRESYLFYLPWLNHNLNANFNLTDAGGPILRGGIMVSCNASRLAFDIAPRKPYLRTILQGARIPTPDELPPIPPDPEGKKIGLRGCGPEAE
jgi:phospholipid/cholesterol/gamma-HCH transport system substrate-binding protein